MCFMAFFTRRSFWSLLVIALTRRFVVLSYVISLLLAGVGMVALEKWYLYIIITFLWQVWDQIAMSGKHLPGNVGLISIINWILTSSSTVQFSTQRSDSRYIRLCVPTYIIIGYSS